MSFISASVSSFLSNVYCFLSFQQLHLLRKIMLYNWKLLYLYWVDLIVRCFFVSEYLLIVTATLDSSSSLWLDAPPLQHLFYGFKGFTFTANSEQWYAIWCSANATGPVWKISIWEKRISWIKIPVHLQIQRYSVYSIREQRKLENILI